MICDIEMGAGTVILACQSSCACPMICDDQSRAFSAVMTEFQKTSSSMMWKETGKRDSSFTPNKPRGSTSQTHDAMFSASKALTSRVRGPSA